MKIPRKGFIVNPLTLCTSGCVAEVSEETFCNSMVIYKIYETFMYMVIHVATPSTLTPQVKFLFLNLSAQMSIFYQPRDLDNSHSLMLQL